MAEIHVQTKKSTGNLTWLWIVLALIIIGVIVYYLMNRNKAATTASPPAKSTSAIQYFIGDKSIADLLQQNKTICLCANPIQQPKARLS